MAENTGVVFLGQNKVEVQSIDFPKMQKILQLAYLSGWRFASEPNPPRFIANPSGDPHPQP